MFCCVNFIAAGASVHVIMFSGRDGTISQLQSCAVMFNIYHTLRALIAVFFFLYCSEQTILVTISNMIFYVR